MARCFQWMEEQERFTAYVKNRHIYSNIFMPEPILDYLSFNQLL